MKNKSLIKKITAYVLSVALVMGGVCPNLYINANAEENTTVSALGYEDENIPEASPSPEVSPSPSSSVSPEISDEAPENEKIEDENISETSPSPEETPSASPEKELDEISPSPSPSESPSITPETSPTPLASPTPVAEEIENDDVEEDILAEIPEGLLNPLTAEDYDAKERLSEDADDLLAAEPGVDYVSNEVICMVDSYEKACEVAEAYSVVTGYDVRVLDFEYGVATFSVSKTGEESSIIDTDEDAVKNLVNLSANMDNDLPPVYADFYRELCSVDTDNEAFTDPFTKAEDKKYQYYHEIIGSKYVWEAIDSGRLEKPSNITVAVIDTGANPYHEDFFEQNPEDPDVEDSIFVGGTYLVSGVSDWTDSNGHGSNVSGIIASVANNKGGRGIASGVRIMPIRTFNASGGGGTDSVIIKGINYAVEHQAEYNVRVINMSLGGPSANSLYWGPIKAANDAGIVICAAAGNYDMEGRYYPAAYDGVISVASVSSTFTKSGFSDFGETVDICAPGGNDVKEYVQGKGFVNRTETLYAPSYGGASSYVGMRGTSQATPIVASAAALVLTYHPEYTPEQVEHILKSTSTKVNSPYALGAGCVNVAAALGIEAIALPPKQILANGSTVMEGDSIYLTHSDDNSVIFYTLDGSDIDIEKSHMQSKSSMGTIKYSEEDGIIATSINNSKTVSIKACELLYGKQSETVKFTYNLDNKLVSNIEISHDDSLIDEVLPVAEGSKVTLKANVYPSYAVNKKVSWSSSNTAVAKVSATGVVSVLSESDTPVIISATAEDGSEVSANIRIRVIPKAKYLKIELPSAEDVKLSGPEKILLYADGTDSYDLSDKYTIYPETACQDAVYSSSAPSIISVDENGVVKGLKRGSATITVKAADGSGVKDTISFVCEVPMTSLRIETSDGNPTFTAGSVFIPKVIFNDGISVPDDKSLEWKIIDGAEYGNIDAKTGKLTFLSNDYIDKCYMIRVQAFSKKYEGVSNFINLYVYPKTEKILINEDKLVEDCYSLNVLTSVTAKTLIKETVPAETMGSYILTSSDESIVAISDTGSTAYGVRPGIATITIKANDGSNTSAKVKIRVVNTSFKSKIGFVNFSGTTILYPGSRVYVDVVGNRGFELDKSAITYTLLEDDVRTPSGYITFENGCVEANELASKLAAPKLVTLEAVSKVNNINYKAEIAFMVYPAKTEIITVKDSYFMEDAGELIRLLPAIYPENAYNEKFLYSSSNEKVVRVYESGIMEAVGPGSATVKVSAAEGSGVFTTTKVTVTQKVTDIEIEAPNNLTDLSQGKSLKLTAKVNQKKKIPATNSKVTWNFKNDEDSSYATIAQTGVLKAKTGITEPKLVTVVATAKDGSGICGEKEIAILPGVKSLSLSKNELSLATKSLHDDTYDFDTEETVDVTAIVPESATTDFVVTSNNKKVATAELIPGFDGNLPQVRVKAVGKGTANIKVLANDGSGKYALIKVKVTAAADSLVLNTKTGKKLMLPSKSIYLVTAVDTLASNKSVKYCFTDPETMEQYATLNAATGLLKAKGSDAIGMTAKTVSVYAVSKDPWGKTSNIINITISPDKVLMKDLHVISAVDRYDLAAGLKLQMKATTTAEASDQRIKWFLEGDDRNYASISSTGVLTANRDLKNKKEIYVRCRALDASGIEALRKVTLYPAIDHIEINSSPPNVHCMKVGEDMIIDAASYTKDGSKGSCNKYISTYTTGVSKAYYCDANSTKVKVYGLKKGRTTITFTALDGSNKRGTYVIDVTD